MSLSSNSDSNKLVSVVIPVFNGEKYIAECLNSVYRQTYKYIEIIIVNDGSTDNSISIINTMKKGNVRIINQQNSDVSAARNTGIRNASGKMIAFLDQDDKWLPEKVEKQAEVFFLNPEVDLVFCDIIKFYPSGKRHRAKDKHKIALSLTDDNLFEKLIVKNVLMPSAVMVKKTSFINAGKFNTDFKTCGDYEMWLRMAALNMKFKYFPEPLTMYRQHKKNVSKKVETMYEDRVYAIKQVFSIPNLSVEKLKMKNKGIAFAYMEGAHSFFSTKQFYKYFENAIYAFSLNKKVINFKFLSRLIRSWIYIHIGKNNR